MDAVPTNSLRMLAHVPAIGGAVLRLIHAIPANADLDLGLRELAILRVTQRDQARYAWTQHAAIAKAIDISEGQIDALEHGQIPAKLFSSRERALLAFVDEALDLPGLRTKHSPGLRRNSLDPWPLRTAVSRE